MEFSSGHTHDFVSTDEMLITNERKTFSVMILASLTMVLEIVFGYLSSSMALTADGWHMASHAGAMLLSFTAYRLAKSPKVGEKFCFGAGKFIPLGGYTSAIILTVVSVLMVVESVSHLLSPVAIHFNEALAIAGLGLGVNLISAVILGHPHELGHATGHDHDHDHGHPGHREHHGQPLEHRHQDIHDQNIRGVYIHVLSDAATSVLAILALFIAKLYNILWVDSATGIVGSVLILGWAYRLCKDTAFELLDGNSEQVDRTQLMKLIETDGAKVEDLHVWRIAPKAVACELLIFAPFPKGTDYYRRKVLEKFPIQHLIVEVRTSSDGVGARKADPASGG